VENPAPARALGGRLHVSPATFTRLALAATVAYALIIVSGAGVRLTGSGLGCPDWPSCYAHAITPAASYHGWIEFGNRLVTGAISILTAATLIAAYRRTPRRLDLIWLSWVLVFGIVAEALWGALVVYTKLNPYTVMVHFLVAPIFLADALVLFHRSSRRYDVPGTVLVPRPIRWASRLLIAMVVLVVAAGTAVSNAGPHAGNATGQDVAKRLPVELRSVVELHGALAMVLIGLVAGVVIGVEALGAAPAVRRIAERLLVVVVAQGAIGILQYATHLPVLLVELHIVGAVSVVIGVVRFNLELVHHEPEPRRAVEASAPNEHVPSLSPT
jgi:cytochrome c oxidase assembly protein subunit 15